MIIGNDYEGFEKEEKLHEIFPKVSEIQNTLQKWGDFIEVAQIINPDLCLGAFDRRPCKRTLRYVGNESNPEPHSYFVRGEIYHTIDFQWCHLFNRGICQ